MTPTRIAIASAVGRNPHANVAGRDDGELAVIVGRAYRTHRLAVRRLYLKGLRNGRSDRERFTDVIAGVAAPVVDSTVYRDAQRQRVARDQALDRTSGRTSLVFACGLERSVRMLNTAFPDQDQRDPDGKDRCGRE